MEGLEKPFSFIIESFDGSLMHISEIKLKLRDIQNDNKANYMEKLDSIEKNVKTCLKDIASLKDDMKSIDLKNVKCNEMEDNENTDCEDDGGSSPSLLQMNDLMKGEPTTLNMTQEGEVSGKSPASPSLMNQHESVENGSQSSSSLTQNSNESNAKDEGDFDYFEDMNGNEFDVDEVEASFKQIDDEDKVSKSAVTDTSESLVDIKAASEKHIKVLKEYFGFTKFRPMQWKIIQSVLDEKRNNCVVMATGAGKSLCYQFPPVYTGGVGVVISPLISLMEDQVQALNLANIDACYLGSAQTNKEIIFQVYQGCYRLVYVTPEYVTADTNFLKTLSKSVSLTCVAIDEAHCVSQWGHDFRTSYRQLSIIQSLLPNIPIIALTATATPQVRLDICVNLKLKNPLIRCTGFDRKNLFLEVRDKSSIFTDLSSFMIQENLNGRVKYSFEGTAIIYCPTKKKTDEVAQVLQSYGVECAAYHAGLSFENRKEVHYKFIRDELNCIVATIAFGMGIDKPDIRLVIHYGAPRDIESYYQEIGRAGRDGLPSHCCAFYNSSDFSVSRHFLNEISNPKFRQYKSEMIVKMEQYLMTSSCRRQAILSHFDEDVKNIGGKISCCDNCKRRLVNPSSFINQFLENTENQNFGNDVLLLLQAISATGNGRFGLAIPVLLLRGSERQKLPSKYHGLSIHGKGRTKSDRFWKALGRQLIMEKMLVDKPVPNGFGSTIAMTNKGEEFLNTHKKDEHPNFVIKNPNKDLLEEMKAKLRPDQAQAEKVQVMEQNIVPTKAKANAWKEKIGRLYDMLTSHISSEGEVTSLEDESLQKELHAKLITVRRILARKLDIPPYMVATNQNLSDMTLIRPTSVEHLMSNVEGISERLCQRFGKTFVEEIDSFCKLRKINGNKTGIDSQNSEEENTADTEITLQRGDGFIGSLTPTVSETYEQHSFGSSIDKICTARGLVEDTVLGHLATALKHGYAIDYSLINISDDDVKKVVQTVRSNQINSDIQRVRAIKDMLPPSVGYGKLRFIINMIEITYGITKDPPPKPDFTKFKNNSTPARRNSLQQSQSSQQQSSQSKRKMPDWMTSRNNMSYKRTNSKNRKIF